MKCHIKGTSYARPSEPSSWGKDGGQWLGYYRCPECGELRAARAALWAPSLDTLQDQDGDGVVEALDGCRVEPDGTCPHGLPAWTVALGVY